MLGVAQEAQGPERVSVVVRELGVSFPVLVDRESVIARELGFGVVPTGLLLEDAYVRYRHDDDFDIGDPRVRRVLTSFLDGEQIAEHPADDRCDPQALALFATGVKLYEDGAVDNALRTWRSALAIDPDNFLIRTQIWVVEHPQHFYPTVDREWQERQLLKEGYEQPLP